MKKEIISIILLSLFFTHFIVFSIVSFLTNNAYFLIPAVLFGLATIFYGMKFKWNDNTYK